MDLNPSPKEGATCSSPRADAIRGLVDLLTPLLDDITQPDTPPTPPENPDYDRIITAMQGLVHTLIPESPLFATFHDGQVHDPLGGGAYAFQNDIAEPVLFALLKDEEFCAAADTRVTPVEARNHNGLPTRPIIIHAGLQPNNSPHVGTLVVFCYAFSFARAIRDRMQVLGDAQEYTPPSVTVMITFIDTAPVKDRGVEVGGVQYQRSHRDVSDALSTYMSDYEEVIRLLSNWADIPFTVAFQSDLFSDPAMPSLLNYMISQRATLGPQLSPKYGTLALRSACPFPGCNLAEKHGRLNEYETDGSNQDGVITFHCSSHGPHSVNLSHSAEVARLEANAPTRNLLRSMVHLLDTTKHHIRVTGADYAGMYQETFLYRPLAAWSASTGLASGRTPHILYAPLIVDWSGAKLSKSLYVRDGGYAFLKRLGMDGFCSYARLRDRFDGDGAEGLRRIWDEVERWVADPKKLFRTFSLAYLQGVVLNGTCYVMVMNLSYSLLSLHPLGNL